MLSKTDFERLHDEAETKRRELVAYIASAKSQLEDLELFLGRLVTTKDFIAKKLPETDGPDLVDDYDGKSLGEGVNMAEMIETVLKVEMKSAASEDRQGGLKPSEVRRRVKAKFGIDVDRQAVNSHLFYQLQCGRLGRRGRGVYFIP